MSKKIISRKVQITQFDVLGMDLKPLSLHSL